jgi:hypothetical protein
MSLWTAGAAAGAAPRRVMHVTRVSRSGPDARGAAFYLFYISLFATSYRCPVTRVLVPLCDSAVHTHTHTHNGL